MGITYVFLLFLLISAVVDIRTKKLPAVWIYGGLIIVGCFAVYQLIWEKRTPENLFFALVPGMLSYLLAKVSGAMGEADGLLILGMGFLYSVSNVMKILMLAFSLAAIGSIFLMVFRKKWKDHSIPFVPYLFLAYAIVLIE